MEKEYKGHKITLNDYDGKFSVSINGIYKKFSSYKSATNAIDREAVAEFKPAEVLIVEKTGWNPAVHKIKKVKITGYTEERGWRRGHINRFYLTDKGEKIRIEYNTQIFPATILEKLTANCEAYNEQQKIEAEASKKADKLRQERDKWIVSYDPKPEQN